MKIAQLDTIETRNGVATLRGFESLFGNIISSLIALAAIGLFFVIVWAGFNMISSGGDPKKASAARQILTQAIIGLLVVSLAFFIIQTISVFTGQSAITEFEIRS